MSSKHTERRHFLAAGQVQGVGFRPFVYRLAVERALSGLVGNTSDGVVIEVQGPATALDSFATALKDELPPLARLTSLRMENRPLVEEDASFRIVASQGHSGHAVLISPDTGICAQCAAEMRDAGNRRYHYPFTNCTNCGPRYTITRAIPYDRATTSMACFPLCPQCRAEYENPLDRRFHAQPNACPVCGPEVWAVEAQALQQGQARDLSRASAKGQGALALLARSLRQGRIAAVKGLGGFHLSCDATNAAAVEELRRRKSRPHKPLAVMVPDLASARRLAHVGAAEEALLCAPEKPIVLCQGRTDVLPAAIAPDTATLGLVLPYTPLHLVLLTLYAELCPAGTVPALVMTSGNAGGEPICLGNREALRRLAHIADVFLLHNRDILVRCDDSVVACAPQGMLAEGAEEASAAPPQASPLYYRRARGYVPRPVPLGESGPPVMGMGPELKATLCLTRGDAAFVGQHVGDLQNVESLAFYREVIAYLEMLLEVRSEALVRDLHPDFLSSQTAESMAQERGIPCWTLQHHFAHAWSVLAEHGHEGKALALALDGTGLGEDGTVWGGELLYVDTLSLEQQRLGRLAPFVLPGGEAAVREPWRVALGLVSALGLGTARAQALQEAEKAAPMVLEMVRRGIHCPATSSAGRLFDAVAAGLGLCGRTSYEGQAAICLEEAQRSLDWTGEAAVAQGYSVEVRKKGLLWELDSGMLFAATLEEKGGLPLAARRFHAGLALGLADMAATAAEEKGVRVLALSGGVLQNRTLAGILPPLLRQRGLTVLVHRLLPANDGGLSLGQAAYGRRRLALL